MAVVAGDRFMAIRHALASDNYVDNFTFVAPDGTLKAIYYAVQQSTGDLHEMPIRIDEIHGVVADGAVQVGVAACEAAVGSLAVQRPVAAS